MNHSDNYLVSSMYRLGDLFNRSSDLAERLEVAKAEKKAFADKYRAKTETKAEQLAKGVIRRKQRAQTLLDEHNRKREDLGEYTLTLDEAAQEVADEENLPLSSAHGSTSKRVEKLELKAADQEPYSRVCSMISGINLEISKTRFEIGDILFELGLREIEENDFEELKTLIKKRSLDEFKAAVKSISEKIAKKVAIVMAEREDRRNALMVRIPRSKIDGLALSLENVVRTKSFEVDDLIVFKVSEFNQRVNNLASLLANPSFDPVDKREAMEVFRKGTSTLFKPEAIFSGLGDFLTLLRTMESSRAGRMLLLDYELTDLFDFSNPVVMLGVAVHFSKNQVDFQKLYAVRRMMVSEDSSMSKEDWVRLFKLSEGIQVAQDPEWKHFVEVLVKQFINTAIYTAAKEGDYIYFQTGEELIDATLFSDHRPEESKLEDRVLLDMEQIFRYVPDRVKMVLEAVRDYNSSLFHEIMRSFYENGLWFAAIRKGNIKHGLKQLWGKKMVKMQDLVGRMMEKAGVYTDNNLNAFKEMFYGAGIAPAIEEGTGTQGTGERIADKLLPEAEGAERTIPAERTDKKETTTDSDPFDI